MHGSQSSISKLITRENVFILLFLNIHRWKLAKTIVGKCTIQHIIQALVNAQFANYTLKQWKKTTMWNGYACKIL
jgi:UDP-galactopyranose mutase